jgi:hypothetical protein
VKLVPSSPPSAAQSGELPRRAEPATAGQTQAGAPAATESWPKSAPAVDELQPQSASTAADLAEAYDDARPNFPATGSTRPPAPKPSRFGWRFWLGAIVLILIAIAIADRRGFGPAKTEVTPETPATDTSAAPPPPAPAPQPSAASPTPTPMPAPQPSTPPPAEPAVAPTPPQPKAAEPAPTAAAAPSEPKPSAAAAPGASDEAASGALSGPLFPSVAGQPDYVVDFVSQPNAATVTIDENTTLTTPATINLGAMPDRIKVTAKKAGFKSSSIWMKRDGFELKAGVLKRRAYITLKEEPEAK